ncbi:hypothetical protein ACFS5N_05810 [Mucilaginibacter ximonensis]|uniref:Uncharacterized protein n=1 Tax=Mucilaginibacter ximonensis TaxID=538021 RepID=A0ABW5Y9C9_9SPHI
MSIHDFANQLHDRITLYKEHKDRPVNACEYDLKPDNEWGASYFLAEVLFQSHFKNDAIISRRRLTELTETYGKEHNLEIDLPSLLEKDWIRVVMDQAQIPSMIWHACSQYRKILPFTNELTFFENLSVEQVKAIKTEDDLLQLAGGKDSLVGRTLNETKNLFWHLNKEKVEVLRLDLDRFLLNHTMEFDFLSRLMTLLGDNELKIGYTDLANIHTRHAAFFSHTPALDLLVTAGMFKPDQSGQFFHLKIKYEGGWRHEAIQDKCGAIVWQKLLDSDDFETDQARLRQWYFLTVYHQGYVNIKNFFSAEQASRFLTAAQALIMSDPDLTAGEREIYKLRSDTRYGRGDIFLLLGAESYVKCDPTLTSLYDIYNNFSAVFQGELDDVLLKQESRHAIKYFIYQLINGSQDNTYKMAEELFAQAKEQPYIFLYTCFTVRWHRPELIPILAKNLATASLYFILLSKIRLTSYAADTDDRIWISLMTDLTRLIIDAMTQAYQVENGDKALVLFQCLERSANKKLGSVPNRRQLNELDQTFRSQIVDAALPGQHYSGAKKIRPLYLPVILDDLVHLLINYRPSDKHLNGSLSLPVPQLDIALWLLEFLATQQGDEVSENQLELQQTLISYFKDTYLTTINTTEILQRDFKDGMKLGIPLWQEYRRNISLISWADAFLHLERAFELDAFLRPSGLVFSAVPGIYDEKNRFIAQKLRTHLFVLIDGFNDLFRKRQYLERSGQPVGQVMTKLESTIHDFVIRYCVADPGARRFDIFHESLERWSGLSENKELLPLIGSISNRFTNEHRESIILALTQADQFVRSLKMLDRVISEKERSRLLRSITGRDDFQTILGQLSFQDSQFVVSILTQHNDLLQIAEDALAHTKKVAQNHTYTRHENTVFLFRMQLLLAYQKKDLSAINDMPAPEITSYNGQTFNAEDEKDFYRALLSLRTEDGKSAYEIFDQLISRASEDRPVLALNRFAAKLQWANDTKDLKIQKALTQEALTQWKDFEGRSADKKKWPDIQENVWYDLLHAAELLNDHDAFDNTYAEVDAETKMRPDFLSIRLGELLKRKMQYTAEELLADAKKYHVLADGNYPDFINELERIANNPETIDFLMLQYDRIFRLAPEELIQVIPPAVNSGRDLPTFLLNELAQAAKDMLDLVNVLPNIDYEDKFTDLILLSLNGRLVNYKWYAANLRGGYSDTEDGQKNAKPNPGEIDLGILTSSHRRFAIGEALILEGKNSLETQSHNLKIFNYDPSRQLFYLLIYYKGKSENFLSAWEKYGEILATFIEFPDGYKLNGSMNALPLQGDHAGIKHGMTLHGTNTKLYHLFININYHLATIRKSVRGEEEDT